MHAYMCMGMAYPRLTSSPCHTYQAALKQEELSVCFAHLLDQQGQGQGQQGQQGQGRGRAGALPQSSLSTAPAAPASSWLSTPTSFPRNVLRRFGALE